jgi:hypothetical protein
MRLRSRSPGRWAGHAHPPASGQWAIRVRPTSRGTVARRHCSQDGPPKTRFHIKDAPKWYASKKKAVTIRHVSEHRVVAVLEIVSPGNKSSRSALTAFVRKGQDLLAAGVHLSLVDLFPPHAA